jgi:hypothetical protein
MGKYELMIMVAVIGIQRFRGYIKEVLGSLLILSSRAEHDFLNIATESLDPNDSYHDHEFILPHCSALDDRINRLPRQ